MNDLIVRIRQLEAESRRLQRERDEYIVAAQQLMAVVEIHLDQRMQCAPVNIKWMDPIHLILGHPPCRLGRTDAEYDAKVAEFEAVRKAFT